MKEPDTMQVEWLDVVDADDRVIERRPRAEIHRLGLRHRATHILVFDSAGRLFLQQRSWKKVVNAGLWDTSAAGHVDPGESYDACARRELAEELGIHCLQSPLELQFKLPASSATGWEFIHVYRTVYDGALSLNADEIDDGRWVTATAIDSWQDTDGERLSETFRHLWTRLRAPLPNGG